MPTLLHWLTASVPNYYRLSSEGTSVSLDGRTLTYSMMSGEFYQFFNFDTATRQSKQLTFTPGDKYGGSWSPDGRWIVSLRMPAARSMFGEFLRAVALRSR